MHSQDNQNISRFICKILQALNDHGGKDSALRDQ